MTLTEANPKGPLRSLHWRETGMHPRSPRVSKAEIHDRGRLGRAGISLGGEDAWKIRGRRHRKWRRKGE